MKNNQTMLVEGFFDPATFTISYIVLDRATGKCAIIDSVMDYDPKSGRTSTHSADRIIARVRELGASVQWHLETHVHADHLSAAPYLRDKLGGRLAIGSHVIHVQRVFGKLFNTGQSFPQDGRQFDHLFANDETFTIGSLSVQALHTPGHTPACVTYVVDDGV